MYAALDVVLFLPVSLIQWDECVSVNACVATTAAATVAASPPFLPPPHIHTTTVNSNKVTALFLKNLILFTYLYSRFLLVISFIHISVYMSIPITQFMTTPPHPPPLPPLVFIRLFSTSVSQFLPCKLVHLYHFSRFHMYALIYDICFSLSDLLHSV